jgi:hypothetical protein
MPQYIFMCYALTSCKRNSMRQFRRTFLRNVLTCYILVVPFIGFSQSDLMPEGRTSALLVYHPASKGMLLIDGYQFHTDSLENDVWKWDGKQWQKLPATGPGSKSLSAGDFSLRSNSIYVFGGIGKGNYEDLKKDLWSFDGTVWKQIPLNDIGTRDHHEMIYFEPLGGFIVYGGLNEQREYDTTTWLIQGNKATSLNIAGPGARYHFAMTYDKVRKKIVLYGGGKSKARDTHWEFDGKRWQQIKPATTPGEKIRHSLVYDEEHKLTLMHGGDDTGTTWGYDGKEWKKVAERGPIADLIALGYDPVRKVVVAFGGSGPQSTLTSALWELKDFQWKKIADNGTWKWVNNQLIRLTP